MLHDQYSPERLRALRLRALLTQPEVERATGVSQDTVSRLETGKARPRTRTLRLLLSLYETRIRSYEAREREWHAEDEQARAAVGTKGRREHLAIRRDERKAAAAAAAQGAAAGQQV